MSLDSKASLGPAGRIARSFVHSKLTPLLIVASVLLGIGAVILLPREEEPQIKVPMIDVMVRMPGFGAAEVEERATRPMEELLWEVPGVEYVYSISRPEESLVIVRFKVGEDREESLVKLNQKLESNFDRIPHGVSVPLIKPRSIDDVPILAMTLHSTRYDHFMLRRLAKQIEESVKQVPQVAETLVIGGARRQVKALLRPDAMAARNISAEGIVPLLQQANRQFRSADLTQADRELRIETGGFLKTAEEVGQVMVGVYSGRPVYLKEVARIEDGPEEPSQYVLFGHGSGAGEGSGVSLPEEPAVTVTVAKRPGANATHVARAVEAQVESLKGLLIPRDVSVTFTRNYGETAAEKSNELLFHMAIAVVSVSLLILFVLGWRESLVVAIAIPCTLALTLLVFYLYGYTLNRITLFALIFSIGILVDDAIVVVENIVRHLHLPGAEKKSLASCAVEAVGEVGNPTILATFAVIAAVLPMAFVGGLMGPYMRPIPIGASAAMLFSLLIAFVVTPWAAVRILPHRSGSEDGHGEGKEDRMTRAYRIWMGKILRDRIWRWGFLAGISLLLLGSMALVGVAWVKVKMLPFDNKSEFQIILNTPEGSSLEHTARVARDMARDLRKVNEVVDYQIYVGTASPFNFNGLVRHYFMRNQANQADIQVNLLPKGDRKASSHEIAKRVRSIIQPIADQYSTRIAVAEVPPGPPVLQTLVAEIYGPTEDLRRELALEVRDIFRQTDGVVDIDWYWEEPRPKLRWVIDKEKAALNGISAANLSETLKMALDGRSIDLLHAPHEKEDVNIVLQAPREERTHPEDLLSLRVRSGDANRLPEVDPRRATPPLVPLREMVRVEEGLEDQTLYHKNLLPVTYVIADVAGVRESPAYAIFEMNRALQALKNSKTETYGHLKIYNGSMPKNGLTPAIKWDGEWHITIEVFRDLGLAFAAVLILIYILMVGWFRSFLTPLIVMVAIPFSLVGILPAHGAMGAFFTATSMIGFMAGAGIVVRNSIILVDFIELRLKQGYSRADAVIDAGAVRFRPMLLTAMAVVVGAGVILFDPIFQGLAISLMAGEVASLLISRMAVPILYFMWIKPGEPSG